MLLWLLSLTPAKHNRKRIIAHILPGSGEVSFTRLRAEINGTLFSTGFCARLTPQFQPLIHTPTQQCEGLFRLLKVFSVVDPLDKNVLPERGESKVLSTCCERGRETGEEGGERREDQIKAHVLIKSKAPTATHIHSKLSLKPIRRW